MFVANIVPIIIVAGASGLETRQSAMIIAEIGTMIQLFFIWIIGGKTAYCDENQFYI